MSPRPPGARPLGFPRSSRIRRRSEFLLVQRRGRRRVQQDLVAVFLSRRPGETEGTARVGFTVSKKVGNAVVRNRVKRRLRESVQHSWAVLSDAPVDVVLIARSSAADATSAALLAQVREAFRAIAGQSTKSAGRTSGGRR
ncbi:MAG: ribonuclease P protein component [Myxococcales bacterium]|nr:ribonuclease P protein component [Myxococcales bacterium]